MKKKIDLQMYAAEAVQGKQLVYLYRIYGDEATEDATGLAFVTENERTKSRDSDSTATKDGPVVTPGEIEHELTSTSLLAVGSEMPDKLEDALDNNKLIEIWEANLAEPADESGTKFKGRYMQGYVTEISEASSAEDHVEISHTFAINGAGVKGDVTVSVEQQAIANYVFKDTEKTGA